MPHDAHIHSRPSPSQGAAASPQQGHGPADPGSKERLPAAAASAPLHPPNKDTASEGPFTIKSDEDDAEAMAGAAPRQQAQAQERPSLNANAKDSQRFEVSIGGMQDV